MGAILSLLGSILPGILDRILPGDDPAIAQKKLELQAAILKEVGDQNVAQLEVNKVEASNPNLFVAGARPFIMWICALGFLITVLKPFIDMVTVHFGLPMIPYIPNEDLTTIMYGLLGLGGLRSFDKIKGIDTKTVNMPWNNPDEEDK